MRNIQEPGEGFRMFRNDLYNSQKEMSRLRHEKIPENSYKNLINRIAKANKNIDPFASRTI